MKNSMDITRLCIFLLFFLVVHNTQSEAWGPVSVRASHTQRKAFRGHSLSRRFRSKKQYILRSTTQEKEDQEISEDSPREKRSIEISSELELPFSAEVAYDAYSNLTRQPSWSSWLHKVEYLVDDSKSSKWTMKFMGLKYSWNAIATRNERPHTIQWKSTSGLQNFGRVKFHEFDENRTLMTLKMTLIAPRAAASLFRRSNRLSNFVEEKMIMSSLTVFRDIVAETDLGEQLE